MMKAVLGKMERSEFQRSITPVLPIKRPIELWSDACDAIIVVSLSTVMILLMRFVLTI
jgi:hypothetical protein